LKGRGNKYWIKERMLKSKGTRGLKNEETKELLDINGPFPLVYKYRADVSRWPVWASPFCLFAETLL
jgi:hypothetical protein